MKKLWAQSAEAESQKTILIYDDGASEALELRRKLEEAGFRVIALLAFPSKPDLPEGIDGGFQSPEELLKIIQNPASALREPILPNRIDAIISDYELGAQYVDLPAFHAHLAKKPKIEDFKTPAGKTARKRFVAAEDDWFKQALDFESLENPKGSELLRVMQQHFPSLPMVLRSSRAVDSDVSKKIDAELGTDFPRISKIDNKGLLAFLENLKTPKVGL
ncbi:MAG: hypothetical protein ACKVOE_09000 [Rickettsiales bacterium]